VTSYRVLFTGEAADDLLRIEDFTIEDFTIERELASAMPHLDVVRRLRDAVDHALPLLEFSPYSCRKAASALNDKQRELIIPSGNSGLIAAFEVRDDVVRIGAIRHQLEQDDH
jgi:plasmid stabilization system protein ParE